MLRPLLITLAESAIEEISGQRGNTRVPEDHVRTFHLLYNEYAGLYQDAEHKRALLEDDLLRQQRHCDCQWDRRLRSLGAKSTEDQIAKGDS